MVARIARALQAQLSRDSITGAAGACGVAHAGLSSLMGQRQQQQQQQQQQLQISSTIGAASLGYAQTVIRRCFSAGTNSVDHLVTAYVKEVLSSLSIPHGELSQLLMSGLSDAAVAAWALTRTASHPAQHQAAAASAKLQELLEKLDAAMLWQQHAASSPLGQLLWQVAVRAAGQHYDHMHPEELQELVDFQVVRARMQANSTGSQASASGQLESVLKELQLQVPLLVDSSQLQVLQQPHFWELASAAARADPSLAEDLGLLGYHLPALVQAAGQQLEQLEQLLGLQAAALQKQIRARKELDGNMFLPDRARDLVAAVAGDQEARQKLAQLQLLQVLAQALGLISLQLGGQANACELVQRLTGLSLVSQPLISGELQQLLAAKAPQLVAAVSQLPASALEQPSVPSLLRLMSGQEQLKELATSLTAWRAAAAADGNLAVLTSLSQAEVAGLSQQQAQAVGRKVMQLEATGRLLMRRAAAGQLLLGQLYPTDAAALAWKIHVGGPEMAQQLAQMMLQQASECYAAAVSELGAAQYALSNLTAGFQLEEATSRLCTAAPPSPLLMAGVPQHQVAEMSEALTAQAGAATRAPQYTARSSSRAEVLVRDLARLLSPPGGGSGGPLGSQGSQTALARLQVVAHDLPKVLSGPLLELLNSHRPEAITDAAAAKRQQQQLRLFLQVLAAELPHLAEIPGGSSSSSGGSSSWSDGAAGLPSSDAEAAEGLVELVGAAEAGEVLAHAAAAAVRGNGRRLRRDDEEEEEESGLYDMLASVHHDIDQQRYLQMEFDAALDLDVVDAPRGWQDPDLFVSNREFLDGMQPLLNHYLAAQGEQPISELEWQVYRDAALTEAGQVEVAAAAAHRAAGHSPFHNSRADEAFLTQRLEAGISKDNVLYAAAHKYLQASFKNRSWRFAQRKHLVDRLVQIAAHLAAYPPKTVRGSPFSALFQPGAPPAVPRLSRTRWQQRSSTARSAGYDDDESEMLALPEGFKPRASAAADAGQHAAQ